MINFSFDKLIIFFQSLTLPDDEKSSKILTLNSKDPYVFLWSSQFCLIIFCAISFMYKPGYKLSFDGNFFLYLISKKPKYI